MKKIFQVSIFCVVALSFVLVSGCSEKSTWSTPSVVLESIPTTLPPRIDGKALDKEWFSAPELLVAMSNESGNGGGNFYMRVKSVYTPYPDTVFFLLEWPDTSEDVFPDRLIYEGLPWDSRDCRADPSLISPASWGRRSSEVDKEDRFAMMFEITPAGDQTGTFASQGCKVACHGNMHPVSGKLDVWYWLDARTNQVGRCDDMNADVNGLVGDTGDGPWKPNWRDPTLVPRFIMEGNNGGLSPAKVVFDPGPYGRGFNQCNIVNPISSRTWGDTLNPEGFDYVPAYLVNWPTQSRGDIIAKANWNAGRWTAEIKRAMRTGSPGEDVFFYANREYYFSIAVMNGSRVIHSGSVPLILRFKH